ncbi:MAG: hypothetical protein ABIQ73_03945 [Acidimicrobiales bacterium]
MSTDRPTDRVDPDSVARAAFETTRRGFDQTQVRSYLSVVAREIERLRASEVELQRQLADAERAAREQTRTDPEHLTQLLGEETARVLNAAREAAAERLTRAEEVATRLRQEADDESARTRQEADASAIAVRDEAATHAREQRDQADEYARSTRNAAESQAALVRATAEQAVSDEIDAARVRGRELVAEAQMVRDRILRDLARRRKQMRVQVEQLRAARDRLVLAHEAVRTSLDEAEEELNLALPNARYAADAAARRLEAEPELTIGQLEEEIALARLANLPLLAPDGDDERSDDDDPLTEEVPALDVALGTRPEAEVEPPVAGDGEPEPELVAVVAVEPDPEPDVEPAPAATVDGEGDGLIDDPEEESAVDALFARIREARSDAVARAYEVFGPADAPAAAVVVAEPVTDEPVTDEPVADEPVADAEPNLFAQRDAVIDPFEAKLARLFKRSVTDEQNEMQDAIRRKKSKVTLEEILADPEAQTARYEDALGTTIGELARAGAAMFELTETIDDESFRPMARRIIDASLVAPLRSQLERAFADTITDDERIDRVRSAYREAKSQRADLVARELAIAGFNAGVIAGAPHGMSVRWVTDAERGCSPDCQDNSLAGPIPAGQSFPTGSPYPPAHQRCRCLVIPDRQ